MPGYIGNYRLPKSALKQPTKVFNSLGCKLVTSFSKNSELNPPKPNILGNIFLFNENTGELKAIIGGSEITAWRTAAASVVSTDHLYLKRANVQQQQNTQIKLAIVGCGVQVNLIHYFH